MIQGKIQVWKKMLEKPSNFWSQKKKKEEVIAVNDFLF